MPLCAIIGEYKSRIFRVVTRNTGELFITELPRHPSARIYFIIPTLKTISSLNRIFNLE